MISELKKAMEQAERLSEKDQKIIAELILNELAWDETFRESQSAISTLAAEALKEYKSGKTKPLDL